MYKKKKKYRIRQAADLRFILIGITSHAKDYRIAFEIQRAIERRFVKKSDLSVPAKTRAKDPGGKNLSFSQYICPAEEEFLTYFLVSNKNREGTLVKEQKSVDFFLVIKGAIQRIDREELIRKLRKVPLVTFAFPIEPTTLPSAQYFLYLEDQDLRKTPG